MPPTDPAPGPHPEPAGQALLTPPTQKHRPPGQGTVCFRPQGGWPRARLPRTPYATGTGFRSLAGQHHLPGPGGGAEGQRGGAVPSRLRPRPTRAPPTGWLVEGWCLPQPQRLGALEDKSCPADTLGVQERGSCCVTQGLEGHPAPHRSGRQPGGRRGAVHACSSLWRVGAPAATCRPTLCTCWDTHASRL